MHRKILELDIGNSRTKWRIHGERTQSVKNTEFSACLFSDVDDIQRVRVSCVASSNFRAKVLQCVEERFGCEVEFAVSTESCAGLINGYAVSSALGVDRWLACLAAWKLCDHFPVLVIDAGSAMTIDVVDEHSVYLGGYIFPGLDIMQKSLVSGTGNIKCDVDASFCIDFQQIPRTTIDAVRRGASFAAVATVEKSVAIFLQRWPEGVVYFTGGDGEGVAREVGMQERYYPDLVLDGLALVLP